MKRSADRAGTRAAIGEPWSMEAGRVLGELDVSVERGLDSRSVPARRRRYGSNRLRRARRRGAWRILLDQFTNPVMLLLSAAAGGAFLMADWVDGSAIGVVILVNAAIGFFTELRAVRSTEALYSLSEVRARVRRDGKLKEVPAAELVVGDVVLVEGGDVVTADLRLVEASRLQAGESALTGESAPVEKGVEPVDADTPLAERSAMLYKGTAVTRGSGAGVVVAAGLASELGRITELVASTDGKATPLEHRLERLARRLIYLTLVLTAAVAALGIGFGRGPGVMAETAIALAVATVPEGLPVVATIALARGLWRMARRNALINRLSAVETLGATGVILTDKTGTLTENRMRLVRLALPAGDVELDPEAGRFALDGDAISPADSAALGAALEAGVLCNNAELGEPDGDRAGPSAFGDPMEAALLEAGIAAGLDRPALLEAEPELREVAFDPEARMMATFHRTTDDRVRVAVKGAPEAVLEACDRYLDAEGESGLTDERRREWLARNDALAADGYRLLALAGKSVDSETADPYETLVFVGLAAFLDPPRGDVRAAIDQCRSAGIRLVMVTGDQGPTAVAVARAVGLIDDDGVEAIPGQSIEDPASLSGKAREALLEGVVFSRVSPEQKLNLIALHQDAGSVVAMTGDGVNDAPALKKADIGVAMGRRGTQVAREAADMVLKDDAFPTIVSAVRQGRVIFENIRKFVLYLLSCNVSTVLVVALATAANAPLPILPLQILFLNVVTDVFPALALGVGPGERRIMERRPRPKSEAIMTGFHWRLAGVYGALISLAVLAAFAWALSREGLSDSQAVTVSFLTLALAKMWHVFNMREAAAGWAANGITGNPWVWGALGLCIVLLFAALYVPLLSDVLELVVPDARMWTGIVGFSIAPLAAGQLWLGWRGRRHRGRG